jgi:DNA-binding Lrp family transcriptional regulator
MMDSTDKEILNRIQREVPLEREPFEAIGRELGIAGDEVIRRIETLKRVRVIRQISAIFDTRVLGYESSLVAARIQAHKLGEGAKAINSHPGVSHNYERNNEFNLWYTVAVPPDSRLGLEGTVDVLHRISGAEKTRILPTLKLFKIGVTLDMNAGATAKKEAPQYGESDRESADRNISEDDKAAIRALQEDVPLTPRPFDLWGRQVGLSYEELLERAYDLRDRKIMRRFSAVLYHRKAASGPTRWGSGECLTSASTRWATPSPTTRPSPTATSDRPTKTGRTPSSPWSMAAASRSARTSSRRWPRKRDFRTTPPSTPPASTRRHGCATSRPRWRPGSASTQAYCADSGIRR